MLAQAQRYAIAVVTLMLTNHCLADTFSIDSKGTYLLADSTDTVATPRIIDLSTLSFSVTAGTVLHIQQLGAFSQSFPSFPDNNPQLSAVFSSNNTLLTQTNLHRVSGAIEAGVDFVSVATVPGGAATDIPEDFVLNSAGTSEPGPFSSVDVVVPAGAHYLFVGVWDSHYADNADPNADLAVAVTAVPEPSSLLLFGLSGAALFLGSGRRARKPA